MSSRRELVIRLAPVAPPCFTSRDQWTEYLAAAVVEQRHGKRGPLDLRQAEPAFNFNFQFCAECAAPHALSMQKQGRCQPTWLKNQQLAQEMQK